MNWKLIRKIDEYFGILLIRLILCFGNISKNRYAKSEIKKILLIKFWGIGNLFMLKPTINGLKSEVPGAEIDFLTLQSSRSAVLLFDEIDDVITIDTSSIGSFLTSWKSAVKKLKGNKYDLVIDFEQFARFSALLSFQVKAKMSIGFNTEGQKRHTLYSDSVIYDNHIHITHSFFSLLQCIGINSKTTSYLNETTPCLNNNRMEITASFGIPLDKIIVLMHIGTSSNFSERRWSPDCFSSLANELISKYAVYIILTGLPEESFLAEEASAGINSRESFVNLSGKLTFKEYYLLIEASDLIVSADTAAVHIASSMNNPVVGLYGPNTPQLYGPWGEHGTAVYSDFECSPCITNFNAKLNNCRHQKGKGACMEWIAVSDVLLLIERRYFDLSSGDCLRKIKDRI